jgi:hypothetical protein
MIKNNLDDCAKACQTPEDETVDIAQHIARFMKPNKEYELESLQDYLLRDNTSE